MKPRKRHVFAFSAGALLLGAGGSLLALGLYFLLTSAPVTTGSIARAEEYWGRPACNGVIRLSVTNDLRHPQTGQEIAGLATHTTWSDGRVNGCHIQVNRELAPAGTDLRRCVIIHEYGHLLGLGHANQRSGSIMVPRITPQVCRRALS